MKENISRVCHMLSTKRSRNSKVKAKKKENVTMSDHFVYFINPWVLDTIT